MTSSETSQDGGSVPGAAQQPASVPRIAVGIATLLTCSVGLLIVMGQLDTLIAQRVDLQGRSWTLGGLQSVGASPDGWRFVLTEPELRGLVRAHARVDLAFVAAWLTLLLVWRRARPGTNNGLVLGATLVAATADVFESLLVLAGTGTPVLPTTSGVKWAGLVLAVVLLLRRDWSPMWHGVRLAGAGAWTHRYSVVLVLPLALLGLGSGSALLEQVPDLQRRWADGGIGYVHCAAATVTVLVLIGGAFVVGRQRSDALLRRVGTRTPLLDEPRPALLAWFVVPGQLVAGGIVAEVRHGPVNWVRLGVVSAVPLVIGVVSLARRAGGLGIENRRQRRAISAERYRVGALVGDLVPGLMLSVVGLAGLRAFTAVVATGTMTTFGWFLFVGAGLCVLLCWWVLARLLARLDGWGEAAAVESPGGPLGRLLVPGLPPGPPAGLPLAAWGVVVVSVGTGLLVGWFEKEVATHLGVLATLHLGWGGLCLGVAAVLVLLQRGGAPEFFWTRGPVPMSYVPLTSLVVLAAVVSTTLGTGRDVHAPRPLPPTAAAHWDPADRPDLNSVWKQWLRKQAGSRCARQVGGGLEARPLVLLAAEGGGIRAAYWTAGVVDLLATDEGRPRPCTAALLSSGASGGALGLTVASVSDPGDARAAVRELSGPQALARASAGLTVRDPLFSAAGIPIGPYRSPEHDGYRWADRAALIEETWDDAVPELDRSWLGGPAKGPTGRLVLNATSATTGCRALVSQVRLGNRGTSGGCGNTATLPGSIDLVGCAPPMRASTAALLSSRFPYVTPSAAVSCVAADGTRSEQQVVDGGYGENTGIGTLNDLTPPLLARIRAHNECVLSRSVPSTRSGAEVETGACSDAPFTLVVPMLVYLDNGPGSGLAASSPRGTPEALVPPLTVLKARATLYSTASQLQRASAALAPLPAERDPLRGQYPYRVFVIHQPDEPGIAAPLGWVLSEASRSSMDRALASLPTRPRQPGDLPHGNLTELLNALDPESAAPVQ